MAQHVLPPIMGTDHDGTILYRNRFFSECSINVGVTGFSNESRRRLT